MRLRAVCATVFLLLQHQVLTFPGCKRLLDHEDRMIQEMCEEDFHRRYGLVVINEKGRLKDKKSHEHWSHGASLELDTTPRGMEKRKEICMSHYSLPDSPKTSGVEKRLQYIGSNGVVVVLAKTTSPSTTRHCGLNRSARVLVLEESIAHPKLTKRTTHLKKNNPRPDLSEIISNQKIKDQCGSQGPLFILHRATLPRTLKRAARFEYRSPSLVLDDRKTPTLTKRNEKCLSRGPVMVITDERLSPPEEGTVVKRSAEEYDLASVPWQALWLLESPEGKCGIQVQETVLRLGAAQRVQNRPHQPLGRCPIRFRPHADPNRWLPRNLVVAECVCEGSPCGRLGTHACITVYAIRTVFTLQAGKRRILLAVGCLCALQNSRVSKITVPQTIS